MLSLFFFSVCVVNSNFAEFTIPTMNDKCLKNLKFSKHFTAIHLKKSSSEEFTPRITYVNGLLSTRKWPENKALKRNNVILEDINELLHMDSLNPLLCKSHFKYIKEKRKKKEFMSVLWICMKIISSVSVSDRN